MTTLEIIDASQSTAQELAERISMRVRMAENHAKKALEYALEIDVMLDGVFPKQTFIDVERLSLMVWNTKRSKILSTMNIVDVDKLLEDTE